MHYQGRIQEFQLGGVKSAMAEALVGCLGGLSPPEAYGI